MNEDKDQCVITKDGRKVSKPMPESAAETEAKKLNESTGEKYEVKKVLMD